MDILHELGQLELGGVERVVLTLATHDTKHRHKVLAHKDGPMREPLEQAGVVITMSDHGAQLEADLIHVHCGGAISELAANLGGQFPVVETIHSPVKSPNRLEVVSARVGVTDVVTRLNPFCQTIYNGIDLVQLRPIAPEGWLRRQVGIPSNRLIVGRIGRIGTDKGMEPFLLACREAQEDSTVPPFDVLIAGPEAGASPGYEAKCRLMADSLPVERCTFVGPQRTADFLNEIDVLLYPSPTEGFGLVFAEAMAMGVPIVSYGTEVAREVCGGHAILTERTIRSLSDGLKEILRREDLRASLVDGARDVVAERFSVDAMVQGYQELYERTHADDRHGRFATLGSRLQTR